MLLLWLSSFCYIIPVLLSAKLLLDVLRRVKFIIDGTGKKNLTFLQSVEFFPFIQHGYDADVDAGKEHKRNHSGAEKPQINNPLIIHT